MHNICAKHESLLWHGTNPFPAGPHVFYTQCWPCAQIILHSVLPRFKYFDGIPTLLCCSYSYKSSVYMRPMFCTVFHWCKRVEYVTSHGLAINLIWNGHQTCLPEMPNNPFQFGLLQPNNNIKEPYLVLWDIGLIIHAEQFQWKILDMVSYKSITAVPTPGWQVPR